MTSTSRPHEDFFLVRISSLTKRKTHGCPWKLPWVFSLSKRKSSRGKNPIGRGNGGEQWIFLFVKQEILTRKNPRWRGGGSWGLPHWQWQKFLTVCFIFLPEEKLISLPFYTWGNPPWPKGFYSWPRDHEDNLIDNDRIFDLVAAAGTSCKILRKQSLS